LFDVPSDFVIGAQAPEPESYRDDYEDAENRLRSRICPNEEPPRNETADREDDGAGPERPVDHSPSFDGFIFSKWPAHNVACILPQLYFFVAGHHACWHHQPGAVS